MTVIGSRAACALLGAGLLAIAPTGCREPADVRIAIVTSTDRFEAATETLKAELSTRAPRRGWGLRFIEPPPESDPAEQRRLLSELLDAEDVDVIVAVTTVVAQTAVLLASPRDVPVVFLMVSDPVEAGIVSDLVSQGANVTGVVDSGASLAGKRLEYLLRAHDGIDRILVPHSSSEPSRAIVERLAVDSARLGVELVPLPIDSTAALDAAYGRIAPGFVDAVYVTSDVIVGSAERSLGELVARLRIPSVVGGRGNEGAIFGLGTSPSDAGRSAAWILAKMLDGIPARDIPVLQAPKPVMRLYLSNARAYEVDLRDSAFWLADEIVE